MAINNDRMFYEQEICSSVGQVDRVDGGWQDREDHVADQ